VINNQHIVGKRKQRGAALILFLLIFMGIGGVTLTGLLIHNLSEIESKKFNHNKRVLEEAKQALLMYAYNYPELVIPAYVNLTASSGPGRLPCPDHDNDGEVDINEDGADCGLVGRFPWNEDGLYFYDARDADKERLWYAVSEEFRNIDPVDPDAGGDVIVNSESGSWKNNITIVDTSGAIQYQGDVNGVAAVIIAPGPPINRDNDGNGTYETVQNRVADENDPKNYLDTFNNFDNSVFNSGQSDSDDDGFILGPIKESDPNNSSVNTIVVNDQIIVVRAEEVIAMAEKAVLQAYQSAIRDYRDKTSYCEGEIPDGETTEAGCLAAATPGVWTSPYPWLDPYDSDDGLLTSNAVISPAEPDPVVGRVPSLFGDYFVERNSLPFDSEIGVALFLSYSDSGYFDFDGATQNFDFDMAKVASVRFVDDGQLTGTVDTDESFTFEKYFHGDHNVAPDESNWTACGSGGNALSDCPHPPSSNIAIVHVTFTFDFVSGDTVNFDMDYLDPPSLNYERATSSSHASIVATFDGDKALSLPVTVEYEFDGHYHYDDSGLGEGGHASEIGTLDISDLSSDLLASFTLGVRYYPELPSWALENEWHNSVLFAYSSAFQPGGDLACIPPAFPITAVDDYCLDLINSGGITNNKAAILVLSGADEDGDVDDRLVDGGGTPNYFSDDLGDIFEGENSTNALPYGGNYGVLEDNLTFDHRPTNGNDVILILD
jgi:hypothetical protein